jgi:hypothetical protein
MFSQSIYSISSKGCAIVKKPVNDLIVQFLAFDRWLCIVLVRLRPGVSFQELQRAYRRLPAHLHLKKLVDQSFALNASP